MFSGKLTGRFSSIDRQIGPIDELASRASRAAWSTDGPIQKLRRGWCRSIPPYDGGLDLETSELGYADNGTGLFRLWIRQDERTVGRRAVQAMASVLASRDGKRDDGMTRQEKQVYMVAAREQLMQRAVPRTKIVECLLCRDPGWVWIGDRSGHETWARRLLYPVCGSVTPDPVCWAHGSSPGWEVLSRSCLNGCIQRDSDELSIGDGVTLMDVRIKGSQVRCSAQGGGDAEHTAWVRRTIRSILDDPSAATTRLTLKVVHGGESTEVTLDEDGLVQADPPMSKNGLIKDRLERRFRDARFAASIAGDAMRRIHAGLASSSVGG